MLTIYEFADFMNVHFNTVLKWIKKGMPYIQLENIIRVDKEKAIKWLEENTKKRN